MCHHERWDGSGYPCGRRGDEIPLAARIFALADTYDAMTSDRPYRAALTHDEAMSQIECASGTQFDPSFEGAFIAIDRFLARLGQSD